MSDEYHHAKVLGELANELKPIFDNSPQGIYLYLDDHHWTCNKRLASMLGYKSPVAVLAAARKRSPLGVLVDAKSQQTLANHYFKASDKAESSTFKVTLKKKSGTKVTVNMIIVPVSYKAHMFTLHFLV